MEHEGDNHTNRDRVFWYSHQRIINGIGGLEGWRTREDYPNYSIIENGQNTEKSPRELRRLTATQTSVKNHQLTLIWKTLKEEILIIFPADHRVKVKQKTKKER